MQKLNELLPNLSDIRRRINQVLEVNGLEQQPDEDQAEQTDIIPAAADSTSYGSMARRLPNENNEELLNPERPHNPQDRLMHILDHLTIDPEESNPNAETQNNESEIRIYPAPAFNDLLEAVKPIIFKAINEELNTFRAELPGALTDPSKRQMAFGNIFSSAVLKINSHYTVRTLLNMIQQEGFKLGRNLTKQGISSRDFITTKVQTHLNEMAELLKLSDQLVFITEDCRVNVKRSFISAPATLEQYKNAILKDEYGEDFRNDEDLIIYVMGRIYQASIIKRTAKEIDNKLKQMFADVTNIPNPQGVVVRLQREFSALTQRFDRQQQFQQTGSLPHHYYLSVSKEPFPSNEQPSAQILYLKLAIAELNYYFENLCENRQQPRL